MNNQSYKISKVIKENLSEHSNTLNKLEKKLTIEMLPIVDVILNTLKQQGTLFICGNGGSAADSQHLASELVCRFKKDRPPIKSIALSVDSSIITSISNDYRYEDIFARQLDALSSSGDCLIGISTSGNSQNILNVFKMAKLKQVVSIGLLGKNGSKSESIVDYSISVPSETTARIQEMHVLIYHILCDLIEKGLGYEQY